jgi:hypothetical protein
MAAALAVDQIMKRVMWGMRKRMRTRMGMGMKTKMGVRVRAMLMMKMGRTKNNQRSLMTILMLGKVGEMVDVILPNLSLWSRMRVRRRNHLCSYDKPLTITISRSKWIDINLKRG